jgi:haloalkane dehalogenase
LSQRIAEAHNDGAFGVPVQEFRNATPASLQMHFDTVTAPLIANNFTPQPSAGPAFMQMAAHFLEELARNTARLPELKTSMSR